MAEKFALKAIITVTDKLSPVLKSINKTLRYTKSTAKSLNYATGGTLGKIVGIGAAVGLGTAAVRLFNDQFNQSAAAMESLRIQMEGVMGSAEKGKGALDWVRKFAEETPLTVQETADSFMLLKNAGIDPTAGALQGIVDQAARVGRGHEQVMGVTLALTQAWQKQKLQGEEIMQLNERLIPTWDLLAKATGKSVPELQKLSSAGKLGRPVIAALIKEIATANAGASEKAAHTWLGITSTMSDRWMNVKSIIMDSGPFDWLKKRLENVNDWMGKMGMGAGSERLKAIGKGMEHVFERIESAILKVDWNDVINSLLRMADGFGKLVSLVGGLDNFAAILGGILAAPLIHSLLSVTLIVWRFGAALLGLAVANPVIAAIAAGAYIIISNWDKLRSFYDGMVSWTTDFFEMIGTAGVDWLVNKYQQGVSLLSSIWDGLKAAWSSAWESLSNMVGGIIDDMMSSILRKIRMLGPLLPSSFAKSSAEMLSEIDRRSQAPLAARSNEPHAAIADRAQIAGAVDGERRQVVADWLKPGAANAPGMRSKIIASGSQRVSGGIDVNFQNAPQGMRVSPAKPSGGLSITPNVGYRSFATGIP